VELTPVPKRTDDAEIPDDALLYRVLGQENWSVVENGIRRVSSFAFKDTLSYEASCFLASEISLDDLKKRFPGKRICGVTAAVVRDQRHIIARAPEEFEGNAAHIVICPPGNLKRKDADKLYGAISQSAKIVFDF
jgi:hypothetical protein